jgi:hypothetical protein
MCRLGKRFVLVNARDIWFGVICVKLVAEGG